MLYVDNMKWQIRSFEYAASDSESNEDSGCEEDPTSVECQDQSFSIGGVLGLGPRTSSDKPNFMETLN
jgi:hypothetical protein